MLVDFSKQLKTPEGEVYKRPPVQKADKTLAEPQPATVGWFCLKALLDGPSSEKATGEERFKRGLLARRIQECQTTLSLKPEDVTLIKTCVGESLNSWLVLQIWPELDDTLRDEVDKALRPSPPQPALPASAAVSDALNDLSLPAPETKG